MALRADQLHSHQFIRRRLISALVARDPDPVGSPVRRSATALLAGVLVAALALAAAGVYGVLRPDRGSAWRDGRSVIVEKESGAVFVYRDGLLHPMLNYASALLALGSAEPGVVLVPAGALAGTPRGPLAGIPGAPAALPAAVQLVSQPWTICSRPTGTSRAESVLLIGVRPAVAAQPLGPKAIFARDPAGGLHLIVNDHRFPIRTPDVVLTALALSSRTPVVIAPAVLNAIPAGRDLGRLDLPWGRGSAVSGARVGQVLVTQSLAGDRQYGVAVPAGLAAITQLQADLILSDPRAGAANHGRAVALSQAEYGRQPRAASLIPAGPTAPPETTPELVAATGVCASIGTASAAVTVAEPLPPAPGEFQAGGSAGSAGPAGPVGGSGGPVGGSGGSAGSGMAGGPATADWIRVAPGRAALVEAIAAPPGSAAVGSAATQPGSAAVGSVATQPPTGTVNLISDLGRRFPVPSADAQARLGYAGVRPVPMPAAAVALIPAGPALDPAVVGILAGP